MIIFTSDLLKISEKPLLDEGDQTINIDWIYCLLKPIISISTKCEITKLEVKENNTGFDRLGVYNRIGVPATIDGWISLYEGDKELGKISLELDKYIKKEDFVICFEAPGYMLKFLESRRIRYIDLNISPIRFSDDYYIGARTKDIGSNQILDKSKIQFADLLPDITQLRALARRKIRKPLKGALFLGQIEIDASLIENGQIPNLDLLRWVLEKLVLKHGVVYYKHHPHSKIVNELKSLVSKINGCEYLERNIYDTLGADDWEMVYSFSSGSIEEAKLFGKKTCRILQKYENYEEILKENSSKNTLRYKNIKNSFMFSAKFWSELLKNAGFTHKNLGDINIYKPGLVKTSLNQTWGK